MIAHRRLRLLHLLAALLVVIGLGLSTRSASADTPPDHTFTVTTFADNPSNHDLTPGDGTCLDATGNCSLRAAVEEADGEAPATMTSPEPIIQIILPPGTYHLKQGSLFLYRNVIRISGQYPVSYKPSIIDGSMNPPDNSVIETVTRTQLKYLKIVGGQDGTNICFPVEARPGAPDAVGCMLDAGAGVMVYEGSTAIVSSVISNNGGPITAVGGGVANINGALSVVNSTINHNAASFGGLPSSSPEGKVFGCSFFLPPPPPPSAPTTKGPGVPVLLSGVGEGGGVYNSSTATIQSTVINNNVAACGGGAIANAVFANEVGEYASGSLHTTGVTMNGNVAGGTTAARALSNGDGLGGAVYNLGVTQIFGGSMTNNTAGFLGGGFENDVVIAFPFGESAANSHITGTKIQGNRAGNAGGGGLDNFPAEDTIGLLIIHDSLTSVTVTGNTAGSPRFAGEGGGLASVADFHLVDSTVKTNTLTGINNQPPAASLSFAGNASIAAPVPTGTLGGGLILFGPSHITSTTITGNSANNGGGIFAAGEPVSEGEPGVYLNNSKVTGNTATTNGGGVWFGPTPMGPTLESLQLNLSFITNNTAGHTGGGLFNTTPGDHVLDQSAITTNTAPTCPNVAHPCS